MSAYALPGLFPPLPLDKNIGISSFDYESRQEAKIGYYDAVSDYQCSSSAVEIRVLEAKIDAAQWIESLTSPPATSGKKRPHTRSCSKTSALTSAQKSTLKSNLRGTVKSSLSAIEDTSCIQERAMQFSLSIRFHGHSSTAVRSLHRIRCLHRELMLEGCLCGTSTVFPELEDAPSCSNFSVLTAVLQSYAPRLEQWLRQVGDITQGDSPALTHFLLEPLGRRGSSLESIEELDHEEESNE